MTTPSHRLKLYRADEHLKDIDALIEPLRQRREYPVRETMKPKRKSPEWEYRLDLSRVQPDERLPILVGDYMFNVRSALDHLAVALAPRKYRHKVSFPICTVDPLARDKASGDYLDAEAAARWASMTRGLPDDCVASLKSLQPYESTELYGHSPKDHALAILSAFQNADKHRELIGAMVGLLKVERHVDGEITYWVPIFKDGTVITAGPRKMNVKIEGAPVVGLQRGDDIVGLEALIDGLAVFIMNKALPALEPFLG